MSEILVSNLPLQPPRIRTADEMSVGTWSAFILEYRLPRWPDERENTPYEGHTRLWPGLIIEDTTRWPPSGFDSVLRSESMRAVNVVPVGVDLPSRKHVHPPWSCDSLIQTLASIIHLAKTDHFVVYIHELSAPKRLRQFDKEWATQTWLLHDEPIPLLTADGLLLASTASASQWQWFEYIKDVDEELLYDEIRKLETVSSKIRIAH